MENLMNSNLKNTHPTDEYYTPIQLKLPLDLETLISFDDPIYTFDKILKECNIEQYLKSDKLSGLCVRRVLLLDSPIKGSFIWIYD